MNSKRILYLGLETGNIPSDENVHHWPIIQIIPRLITEKAIQEALSNFNKYTHVIVTSKSTVAILKKYLLLFGIPLEAWKAKKTIAVGKVTAKHLHGCGIKPVRIASEETAEGIVKELEQFDLSSAHIFWPHSSKARTVLTDFFEAQIIQHTACILYDPKIRIPGPLPLLEEFDEIIFTSPSTVDAFLEVFGYFPPHVRLTPIGPITARHLEMKSKTFSNTFNKIKQ